jgi:hypothetical protein
LENDFLEKLFLENIFLEKHFLEWNFLEMKLIENEYLNKVFEKFGRLQTRVELIIMNIINHIVLYIVRKVIISATSY